MVVVVKHSLPLLFPFVVGAEEDKFLLMGIGHKAQSYDGPWVDHHRLSIGTALFDGYLLGSAPDDHRLGLLCNHLFSSWGCLPCLRPSADGEEDAFAVHPKPHQMLLVSGTTQLSVHAPLVLVSEAIYFISH